MKSLFLLSGVVGGALAAGLGAVGAPPAGGPVDVVDATRVLQNFAQDITGIEVPDLSKYVKDFKGETVLEAINDIKAMPLQDRIKGIVKKVDIKGVQDALKSIHYGKLVKEYFLPIGLFALNTANEFTGEQLLEMISTFDGKQVLDQFRAMDASLVVKAIEDFQVVPFVKAIFNVDVTPVVQEISKLTGARLVGMLEKINGQRVAKLLNDLHVVSTIQSFGLDIAPLLEHFKSYNAGMLLSIVEDFDGAEFLKEIGESDGTALVMKVNKLVNGLLSNVRTGVSLQAGGTPAAAYEGFDVFNIIHVLQAFGTELTGIQTPDVTAYIKMFSGAAALDLVRGLDIETAVDLFVGLFRHVDLPMIVESLLEIDFLAAFYDYVVPASKQAMQTADTISGSAVLKTISSWNGERVLDLIKNVDPSPLVKAIQEFQVVPIVKALTTIDVTPYVDAIANFSGERFLQNVEAMTGDRIVKLLDDLKISDYFRDFPGLDITPFYAIVSAIDGGMVLDLIRGIDGKDLLALFGGMDAQNVNNLANAAIADVRQVATAPVTKAKLGGTTLKPRVKPAAIRPGKAKVSVRQ